LRCLCPHGRRGSNPLPRTSKEIASFEGSPRFARRLIRIVFSGQKRIGDFERRKEKFLIIKVGNLIFNHKTMSEQFKGEKGPASENLEDQKHRELQEAMDEEDRIMREIDNVLASTQDKAEAEKIVLEKLAPLMDEAMKKSSEALRVWLDTMREASERERKELNDMEKDLGKE